MGKKQGVEMVHATQFSINTAAEDVKYLDEAESTDSMHGYELQEPVETNAVFEAEKKRLEELDQMTRVIKPSDYDALELVAPPDFKDRITDKQRDALGVMDRKKYDEKQKKYEQERKAWEGSKAGLTWKATIEALESRVNRKEQEMKVSDFLRERGEETQSQRDEVDRVFKELSQSEEGRKKQMAEQYSFPPSSGLTDDQMADAMDRAYLRNPEFLDEEKALSEAEARVYHPALLAASPAFFTQANRFLRGYGNPAMEVNAISRRAAIFGCRMNRDLVTRRGVRGVDCLARMAGLDPDSVDPATGEVFDEAGIIRMFRESLKEEEGSLIISDKGFFSTSLHDHYANPAAPDPYQTGSTKGVEFVVLVRKGTCAANTMSMSDLAESETEVLLAPGTRFRVVKAFFNEDPEKPDRAVFSGTTNSVKVYLEALPPEGDGEERQ